jgi:hypothetical protein
MDWKNCSTRDILIFLAGAELFHTLSHIILPYFVQLPLMTSVMEVTVSVNRWAVVINAVLTVVLLMAAKRAA